jgi:hypothetical protein
MAYLKFEAKIKKVYETDLLDIAFFKAKVVGRIRLQAHPGFFK